MAIKIEKIILAGLAGYLAYMIFKTKTVGAITPLPVGYIMGVDGKPIRISDLFPNQANTAELYYDP